MDKDCLDSRKGKAVEPPGRSIGSTLFQECQIIGIDFRRYTLNRVTNKSSHYRVKTYQEVINQSVRSGIRYRLGRCCPACLHLHHHGTVADTENSEFGVDRIRDVDFKCK